MSNRGDAFTLAKDAKQQVFRAEGMQTPVTNWMAGMNNPLEMRLSSS